MKNGRKYIFYLLALPALLALMKCGRDNPGGADPDSAVIYLSVRAAASSINLDQQTWEDRVTELRMIVAEPGDGTVVFNQKLYFPDGFDQSSRPVEITPGSYDFYFFANETVYTGDFVQVLMDIGNVSEFSTDNRFTDITYRPKFTPDGSSSVGRFLMSAIYEDITVAGGGTFANPVPLPLPTARVELIRALAKVEVVFRQRVSGATLPENTITSVELENVASLISVPPMDTYYNGGVTVSEYASLEGFDYGNDSIGSVVFYIPEFLVPVSGTTYTELVINNTAFPIESDATRGGLTEQRRTVPTLSDYSVIRNYHYIVNVYINSDGGLQLLVYVKPWQ